MTQVKILQIDNSFLKDDDIRMTRISLTFVRSRENRPVRSNDGISLCVFVGINDGI